jgi:HPt (histidine-containing phosphotransfer) domain-containing protein
MPIDAPLIDADTLSDAKSLLKAKFEPLLKEYLTQSARHIATMQEALARADAASLAASAHTLGSSSKLMGASAIGHAATSIEQLARKPETDWASLQQAIAPLTSLFEETKNELTRTSRA